MQFSISAASFAATLFFAGSAIAGPLALTPANPQPSAGSLASGLSVIYAYPGNVQTIKDAKNALKKGKPGKPLAGLYYDDNNEGDLTMTAEKAMKVAASISGYIKFEAPGSYTLDFLNNDGLEIFIGGQKVGFYDGVHACGYAGEQEVEVPSAGYYALEATYFQKKGTACLMMEWGPDSDGLEPVPNTAFFYKK
jgi:hypothetical protein